MSRLPLKNRLRFGQVIELTIVLKKLEFFNFFLDKPEKGVIKLKRMGGVNGFQSQNCKPFPI